MSVKKVISPVVIFSMFFAFISWGAWAYFVNSESSNVLMTTVLQGIYSALMTLYMSFSIYFIYSKCKESSFIWILPTLGTVGHTGAILILVHYLNDTAHLLKTVALPLLVATGYGFLLTWKLTRT